MPEDGQIRPQTPILARAPTQNNLLTTRIRSTYRLYQIIIEVVLFSIFRFAVLLHFCLCAILEFVVDS